MHVTLISHHSTFTGYAFLTPSKQCQNTEGNKKQKKQKQHNAIFILRVVEPKSPITIYLVLTGMLRIRHSR